MAVIKIFDSVGVKTLVLMGNAMEQDYDPASADEDEFSNFVVEEEDN